VPRIHLRVEGRVQGVGFRWFVREQARALGVAGWVRNLPDGCVELQAEGPDDALAAFTARVRSGPAAAEVRAVVSLQTEVVEPLKLPFLAIR